MALHSLSCLVIIGEARQSSQHPVVAGEAALATLRVPNPLIYDYKIASNLLPAKQKLILI
jgi:hypothetical protein